MAKSKIIKELANNDVSTETALSRLLVIAEDIDNTLLSQWAEKELIGYHGDHSVPEYRIVHNAPCQYSGINGSFQVNNQPFPIQRYLPDISESILSVNITDSVGSIEKAISGGDAYKYARDLTGLSGAVYNATGISCTKIVQVIPYNALTEVISNVRTILLKIFIKLDKTYGCLDNMDIDTSDIEKSVIEQTNATINNYIYVDNSISVGDRNRIDGSNMAVGGKE